MWRNVVKHGKYRPANFSKFVYNCISRGKANQFLPFLLNCFQNLKYKRSECLTKVRSSIVWKTNMTSTSPSGTYLNNMETFWSWNWTVCMLQLNENNQTLTSSFTTRFWIPFIQHELWSFVWPCRTTWFKMKRRHKTCCL